MGNLWKALFGALIKPIMLYIGYLKAKREGKTEAEREALEEHAKVTKIGIDGRVSGERDGLREEDYRD